MHMIMLPVMSGSCRLYMFQDCTKGDAPCAGRPWCALCQSQATGAVPAAGDAAHHIELLLLDSIASSLDAARLCAAQWAVRLFPFSHAPARYIACLACGDSKLEIRETGAAGLRLQKPAKQLHSSGISKATGTDGQALPQLADLTAFVCSRHRQLRGPAQQNEALALPAKAYVALVQFLSRCQDRETGSGALSAEALDAYLGRPVL